MEEQNLPLKKPKKKLNHRLTRRNHFAYIYRKGTKFHSKFFTLFVVSSKSQVYRIGYSISKKVGKATKRNLLKRRLREIVRNGDFALPKHNYVLLAKEGAAQLSFAELEKEINYIFKKAKV